MGTFNSTSRVNIPNGTIQDIQLQEMHQMRSLRSPLMLMEREREGEGFQLSLEQKEKNDYNKHNDQIGQKQQSQLVQRQINEERIQNRPFSNEQSNSVHQRGFSSSDFQLNSDDQYIEIPIPQFVLRDSFLLFWFRRIDRQFTQLVQFFMYIFMGMYYISLVMPFGFVLVTIFITSPQAQIYSDQKLLQILTPDQISNVNCLMVKHFFSMNNWMLLDATLTILIFLFILANLFYQKWVKRPHKRRIKKIKRKILSTWVIIFSIKYFIWNLLGTMEYFNHIRQKFYCSNSLDIYIQVQLLFNYLSIIPLSIFALTNLI